MRMACLQAHMDSGFDYEAAIIFTQIDTVPQQGTIEFEADFGDE